MTARTGTDDDEKVSTPVGDRPTRDRAGHPRVPGRSHRSETAAAGVEPVTVEQLLARQGSAVGRRAARRTEGAAPVVRTGLPPVPGGLAESAPQQAVDPQAVAPQAVAPQAVAPQAVAPQAVASQAGLPPVPGVSSQPGLPPVPGASRPVGPFPQLGAPAGPPAWPGSPAGPPSRRSGPIPPLPGMAPPGSGRPGNRRTGRAPDRPPLSPGRRRLIRSVVALAAVLGVIALYHLGLYFYVDRSIERVDALAVDGAEVLAPALQEGTETYLIVGTGVPGESGPASVSTLLASVSPDGERAVLVSVPPTSLVDTPACRTADGDLREPTTEAFAAALLDGGPTCLVRAVQQISGLRVDHYLGVDLARLPGMVDALGGVPVCQPLTEGLAAAAQPLPPGTSVVSGRAASGYLRPGDDGSDVAGAAVAERSQLLLTSTLRAALSVGTLADPVTLTRFLSRAADALTVDRLTTLGDLRVLASTLGDLDAGAVQRAGLPVEQVGYVPAGTDEAYVLLDGVATRTLFDAVIDRTSMPADVTADGAAAGEAAQDAAEAAGATAPGQAPTAAAGATAEGEGPAVAPGPEPLTVAPAQVTVDVLNGTAVSGLAATVGDALRAQGFAVGAVGNEAGTVNETLVRYGPDVLEQARTVAAAVPGAVLQPSEAIGGTVQLVLGPGYSAVVPVTVGPPAPEAAPDTPAADTPAADTAAPDTAAPTAPAEPAPVTCS